MPDWHGDPVSPRHGLLKCLKVRLFQLVVRLLHVLLHVLWLSLLERSLEKEYSVVGKCHRFQKLLSSVRSV